MHWIKQGRIFDPESRARHPKLGNYASNPLALQVSDEVFRIYYSGRDSQNRSSVGAFDFNIRTRVIVSDLFEPLFEHGSTGSISQDGVSIGNCFEAGGSKYIYYMGWQIPSGQHWRGDIGSLTVTPDFRLTSTSEFPIIPIDQVDPISLSYPWVHVTSSGKLEMIYGSTLSWSSPNGEMVHVLNSAISSDEGRTWVKKGLALNYELGVAQAFSRPTLYTDPTGQGHMWFSYRAGTGDKYKIGYAKRLSEDANWTWVQSPGITPSTTGWDSEMIEYPFVFEHDQTVYMLYNGNGHGKSGIGLALLSK